MSATLFPIPVDSPLPPPAGPRRARGTLAERFVPTTPQTWQTPPQAPAPIPHTTIARPTRRVLTTLRVSLVRAAASDAQAQALGQSVRQQLEALSGAWPSFGVFLSTRTDLFPLSFCDELATISNAGVPMTLDEVAAIFQEDFNKPMDLVLCEVEPAPVWASTLAQLHVATLRETGERVWVQVQRADAADRVKADLAVLGKFCDDLGRLPGLKKVPWLRVSRVLQSRLTSNLDYRFSAHVRAKQWSRWRRQPGAHAPKVYRPKCSRRFLVLEYLEGVPLARLVQERAVNPDGVAAWLEANDIKPRKLARRLYLSFLRELVEHHVCHAAFDNWQILLFRNSRFGVMPAPRAPVVQVETDRVRAIRGLIRHLPERAYGSACTDLLGLVEPMPQVDPIELKKNMTRELRAWGQRDAVRTLPGAERTLSGMFLGVMRLFRERNVVLDANVAAALHSLRAVEAAVLALYPRLGRIRLLRRFFVQSAVRMARAATRRKERADAMVPAAEASPDVPYDMLDQAERQAETVSEQSLQFANTASKPAYMFEQFFSGLRFLVVVVAFLTIILFVDQEIDHMDTLRGEDLGRWLTMMPQLSWLEYVVAAVVESWLFVLFHRITLRFRTRDSELPGHAGI